MDLKLKGKTVIITGATKGIGAGMAQVFAEEGANLVINYRSDPEGSEAFIQSLRDKYGVRAIGVMCEMGTEEATTKLFDAAEAEFGQLDVLINNAGGAPRTMLMDISLEEWNDVLQKNLTAYFLTSREFARRQIPTGRPGRIVNMLSKASLTTTTPAHATYVTNKTAQMGLTKQLAVDLTQYGIICNGIMAGSVRNQKYTPEHIAYKSQRTPLKRIGEPYEFSKMVAFLASEECTLAVGSVVDYTAGMMLGY